MIGAERYPHYEYTRHQPHGGERRAGAKEIWARSVMPKGSVIVDETLEHGEVKENAIVGTSSRKALVSRRMKQTATEHRLRLHQILYMYLVTKCHPVLTEKSRLLSAKSGKNFWHLPGLRHYSVTRSPRVCATD